MGNSVVNVVGNAAGNFAGNLEGNGLGNDAIFSLNTCLRTIYCLQTIQEPACVILTLFQFFITYLSYLNSNKMKTLIYSIDILLKVIK